MNNGRTIKIIEERLDVWAVTSDEAMEKLNKIIEKFQKEYDEVRLINVQRGKEDFNNYNKFDYIAFIELTSIKKKII